MNQRFIERYAANMKANSDANPGEYCVPSSWTALSEKMSASILNDTAIVSDMARKTAKQLGFKPNIAGVKEAITQSNEQPGNAGCDVCGVNDRTQGNTCDQCSPPTAE